MMEKHLLTSLLEKWGMEVQLEAEDGTHSLRAVLQPVRDRSKQYLEDSAGPFGYTQQGRCVCWTRADGTGLLLKEGMLLQAGEQRWLCQRREIYHLHGEPFYLWAILREAEEVEP